jgi:23S rRNA (adenine2503-C2)-methyltransferase
MGMGEPLQNYDNVPKRFILHDDYGLAGRPDNPFYGRTGAAMERLAAERVFPNCRSLNRCENASRDRLMPINRKYPIEASMEVVRKLPLARQNRVMFECVMIKGVTDSPEDARGLARLLQGMRAKVNLIPLNPAPEIATSAR